MREFKVGDIVKVIDSSWKSRVGCLARVIYYDTSQALVESLNTKIEFLKGQKEIGWLYIQSWKLELYKPKLKKFLEEYKKEKPTA